MRTVIFLLLLATGLAVGPACRRAPQPVSYAMPAARINWVVDRMQRLMRQDVTNPPLAARFYAYTMLAGYEVLAQSDSALVSMHGRLRDYPRLARPARRCQAPQLAALFAMLHTAGKLQPSGAQLAAAVTALGDSCRRSGVPEEVVAEAQAYGQQVGTALLAYAKQDGYNRISNYPRYTPTAGRAYWSPTPPAFFGAVEPYFNRVRPFVLTSAAQFRPVPPTAFDSLPGSGFASLMREVYQASRTLTAEQRTIAAFWDCNPFALREDGHLRLGLKKMSPGGHWMAIAGTACRQRNTAFAQTLQIHAVLAVVLTDAFICCWDEKYRSNRIRPETVIRHYVDPTWKPLLQTPPFPEYLSGHSVISTAAAEVLTRYFGPDFAYADATEQSYGLPTRRFTSFRQAAAEAAISRLYGGIHFRDAIERGQQAGLAYATWALPRLLDHHAAIARTP
ncbi:vanadium-dependent haloperoxidase [Hymenobacter jeollabukensis]|uniref:Vanadium-dependent haloperoxidase n=1 Tax=Hymenobacter jeollabukensis TaxID=2025313 RepID=A0A5R8WXW8_9BACT|nr:vanadium-dependent haloperoxidase [Hymenobacter jeollabukensis]TLM97062.1 vanadium-dependent haloperoxidase [Hymenobacter jeollabukensis]